MKRSWVAGIIGAVLVVVIAGAVLVSTNSATDYSRATEETEHFDDTPPPTDEQQVLAQLTQLENEWTVANINADKQKLARILADDYVRQVDDNLLEGKAEYLRLIDRDLETTNWEFSDLSLTMAGDRATLSGKIAYTRQGRQSVWDFTDRFVWRNGRWQATAAELRELELRPDRD